LTVIELAKYLKVAEKITVLTGAGVSAESGVPTFRGSEGLWKTHRPERLATPEAFTRDPELVWEWYDWRRRLVAKCQPNAAHITLATWSQTYSKFSLITQNVDGLHERAGTATTIRFHGSIWELCCWNRCSSSPERWTDERVPLSPIPPLCPACGHLARPGVVWFGESINKDVLTRSLSSADCDVFLTIGTSGVVYPAASLTKEAKLHGALTIEINPEDTPHTEIVDARFKGSAAQVLTAIEAIRGTS
tara:strand:+ start:7977 stop:8720 length:744 start_codon:yes stop_codon:yes gene_type:complete